MNTRRTQHTGGPKADALRDALKDRDPFYTGICTIPEEQRNLYYTDASGIHRCIDFFNTSPGDLEILYHACKPEEFGRNALGGSYGEAGKMDRVSFATLIDPRALGIHEQIFKALVTESHAVMELELDKLNVWGKGNFFKACKDISRAQNTFGSLVIVLPSLCEGGQLIFRQSKEWIIDFADKFSNATEPSVCFIAFYGDIEHEVLPITSGYRVTLTYNLRLKPIHHTIPSIPTPYHLNLRQALADIVNDKSKLPNGGYLGFGLVHWYVYTGQNRLGPLQDQLKGPDRALIDACDVLGIPCSIRLLYSIYDGDLHFLATEELDVSDDLSDPLSDTTLEKYLTDALEGLTQEQVEGVVFVGEDKPSLEDYQADLGKFYKDPMTEVLGITKMWSSVEINSPVLTCDDQGHIEYFHGMAWILLAVEPAESRRPLGL